MCARNNKQKVQIKSYSVEVETVYNRCTEELFYLLGNDCDTLFQQVDNSCWRVAVVGRTALPVKQVYVRKGCYLVVTCANDRGGCDEIMFRI